MRERRWFGCLLITLVVLAPTSVKAQSTETLIDDLFNGPWGASLTTRAPDTNLPGGSWTLGGAGTPAMHFYMGAAAPAIDGPLDLYAIIESGIADGRISTAWMPVVSPEGTYTHTNGGVVFRYVSPTNYLVAYYYQARIYLRRWTGSGFVDIASAVVPGANTNFHPLEVRLDGSQIQVWWDGEQKIQATDASNLTATKHGIWTLNYLDRRSMFDRFTVVRVIPPPVTQATASPSSLTLPLTAPRVITATGYSAANVAVPSTTFTWTTSNAAVVAIESTTSHTASVRAQALGTATVTATSANGVPVSVPITVTSTCAGECVYDDFIGTGSSIGGQVPQISVMGGSWSIGGSPDIVGYTPYGAYPTNMGAATVYATIESAAANATVAASWMPIYADNPPEQVNGGILLRYVSATNYLVAYYYNARVYLRRWTAAGFVDIASAAVAPASNTYHVLEARLDGSSIQVWWDGEQKIQATEWSNLTATRHGIWWLNSINYRSVIGDFRVIGTPPPPPATTVAVTPASLIIGVDGVKALSATGYRTGGAVAPETTFTWTSSNPSIVTVTGTGQTTASIQGEALGTATITALASSGVSASIPVTVTNTCVGQCVVDDLVGNASDPGTSLQVHTPDINVMGGPWSVGGTPGITFWGYGAIPSNHGPSHVYGTIESGAANGTVSVNWLPVPAEYSEEVNGGVVFRYVNDTSYFTAYYYKGRIYLRRMTPTGFAEVGSAPVEIASLMWHGLEVRLDGPSIQVWWDSQQRIQATDWTNVTATRHGIRWGNQFDAGSRIADFTVIGAPPPLPVTTVTVSPANVAVGIAGVKTASAIGHRANGVWGAHATYTWASSDPAIATVEVTGPTTARIVGAALGTATITALSSDGPSSSLNVTVTETCLGTCVSDSFAGVGGLQTHTPDIDALGRGWTVTAPGINLAAGIVPAGTGSGQLLGTIDSGAANGTVGATWRPTAGDAVVTPSIGLIARYVSPTSYLLAYYEGTKIRLYKQTTGGYVLLQQGDVPYSGHAGFDQTMQIRLDGAGVQVFWNNELRLQVVDSTNVAATRHGVYWNLAADAGSKIINFGVTGMPVTAPSTVRLLTATTPSVQAGGGKLFTPGAYTSSGDYIYWTSFTWHSSNPDVATVSSYDHASGSVVGHSSGRATITATSPEGLTYAMEVFVTVEESEATVKVFDSFVGPIFTLLSSHVPETNEAGGTWAIGGAPNSVVINDSNQIFPMRQAEYEFATIESGTANGTVSATFIASDVVHATNGAVIFRHVSNDSFWYAQAMYGQLHLRRVTSTGHVTVASAGIGHYLNAHHQIAVLLDGPNIQVWFNGYLYLTVTDSTNELATRHGVLFKSETAYAWLDNFSVNTAFITPERPPQPVLPCVNGVWPPNGQDWSTAGGTDAVTLSAPFGCAWTATATVPWIHLAVTSGIGDAYVEYSVEPNTSGARTGAIQFGNGWSYPIRQAPGGTLLMTFQVLDAAPPHSPVAGAAITLSPDYGGTGTRFTGSDGRISFVADGGPLSYTVSKGGYFTYSDGFTVTQADSRTILLQRIGAPTSECTISVTPQFVLLGRDATTAQFAVTAASDCAWNALSTQPFVQIVSGHSGTGNGLVTYSVSGNDTGLQRHATIRVSEAMHEIRQRAFSTVTAAAVSASTSGYLEWQFAQNRLEFEAKTTQSSIDSGEGFDSFCECLLRWRSKVSVRVALQAPDGSVSYLPTSYGDQAHIVGHIDDPFLEGQWALLRWHYYHIEWERYFPNDPEEHLPGIWEPIGTETSEPREQVSLANVYKQAATLTLFLDVDGNFSLSNPVSDHASFLPGSNLAGASVPLPQSVRLIAAYIDAEGRVVPPPSHAAADFSLSGTSAFAGIAMNAGDSLFPDYAFSSTNPLMQQANASWGMSIPNVSVANLYVHDYGGFTRARITHGPETAELQLPIDAIEPRNALPDIGWRTPGSSDPVLYHGNSDTDNELGATLGDGLTAFEEYRGFFVGGVHTRTRLDERDFFVESVFGIGDAASSGLTLHEILASEFTPDNYINFNYQNHGEPVPGYSSAAHYNQKGARLKEGGYNAGASARMFPEDPTLQPHTPAFWTHTEIYSRTLRQASPTHNNQNDPDGVDGEKLQQTVAHELGHWVFLRDLEVPRQNPSDSASPAVCPAPIMTVMVTRYFVQSNGNDVNACPWSNIPHAYSPSELQQIRLR